MVTSVRRIARALRTERAGGALLLAGAVVALLWANSPWVATYEAISQFRIGPESWGLNLSVAEWAKDGLLAIFFFVVGLELKHEIVVGELRRIKTAIVPVVAAVGGMAAPALVYLVMNVTQVGGSTAGWAVPAATDIAFAVAVLAVVGRWLPVSVRAFLLTLAVVDDLLAIVVIAIFFTNTLSMVWLACAAASIAVFAVLLRRGVTHWWLLVPLAIATWGFMHASGVHATIAGVALGMVTPALKRPGESISLAQRWEHMWRPISAGLAVPIFALFAAGIPITASAISYAASDPVAQGVYLGLVLGKPLGIVVATLLVVRLTSARLAPGLQWADIVAVGFLAGIGFTVSLLIGDLSFGGSRADEVKMAVLLGSTTAALVGGLLLAWRSRHHRQLATTRTNPPA